MNDLANILGLTAGALCTISFLPQVIKILKTRSARDVSLGMFIFFSAGVALWLVYGIIVHSVPIIAANALTLFLSLVILACKIKYG